MRLRIFAPAMTLVTLAAFSAWAQLPATPPSAPSPPPAVASGTPVYGPVIALDAAKRVMAAAEAEAVRNNWAMVVAIIDSGGNLVMLHRLDNAQLASLRIAQGKARTALEFRRPTKALEDAIASGGAGLRLLALDGVTPIDGGLLLTSGGRIVGAIGVSGGSANQDGQVAKAGADALN
jgi:uncharacterized protein GlcG (DUF336 family)